MTPITLQKSRYQSVIHSIQKVKINVLRQSTLARYGSVISLYNSFLTEVPELSAHTESERIYSFIASAIDNKKISGNTVRVYLQGLFTHFPNLTKEERSILGKLTKSANNINKPVPKRKRPLSFDQIKQMISHCDLSTNQGIRDRLILSLMYSGGFRRSEITTLKISDISTSSDGLEVTLYTKTGFKRKFIRSSSHFPLTDYLSHWLNTNKISSGLIFHRITKEDRVLISQEPINPVTVCRALKKYAEKIGINSDLIGGHSTRRGVATDALRKGANIKSVQNLLGHSTPIMSLHYQDEANSWQDHATNSIY